MWAAEQALEEQAEAQGQGEQEQGEQEQGERALPAEEQVPLAAALGLGLVSLLVAAVCGRTG